MVTYLIAVGARAPAWVDTGFEHYARRLPRQCALELIAVPAVKRGRGGVDRIRDEEGRRLHQRVPRQCHVVALAEHGKRIDTRQLAAGLSTRMQDGVNLAMLVGGADGLSRDCISRADECWSLSALTFPHALVRVIVAEQLYRAWTILSNHPYHRE